MMLDFLPEWLMRQARWRWPCKDFYKTRLTRGAPKPLVIRRRQIETALSAASFGSDETLLVHANTTNVSIESEGEQLSCPVSVADTLLGWIREIAGPRATIVMPTYPYYREVRAYDQEVGGLVLNYNPRTTPSKTGLVSEVFRRTKGCLRSNMPLQSMAALGPRAEDLIRPSVLPTDVPPHGEGSPHHRVCLENALVVGIGLDLHRYLTLVHVAEDLKFAENRRRNFYRRRDFIVKLDSPTPVHLWERRPEFARVFCAGKFHRDIVREGLLREDADGSSLDWIRAGKLREFMSAMTARSTYPYYLPSLAGPFRG
jgi:aminoglycoside N3'-acetyltransferase